MASRFPPSSGFNSRDRSPQRFGDRRPPGPRGLDDGNSSFGREPPRGPRALVDSPRGGPYGGGRGRGYGRGDFRDRDRDLRDRDRDRDFRDNRDGPPFRRDMDRAAKATPIISGIAGTGILTLEIIGVALAVVALDHPLATFAISENHPAEISI